MNAFCEQRGFNETFILSIGMIIGAIAVTICKRYQEDAELKTLREQIAVYEQLPDADGDDGHPCIEPTLNHYMRVRLETLADSARDLRMAAALKGPDCTKLTHALTTPIVDVLRAISSCLAGDSFTMDRAMSELKPFLDRGRDELAEVAQGMDDSHKTFGALVTQVDQVCRALKAATAEMEKGQVALKAAVKEIGSELFS